ncbi:T9SS type A sorting domain-containing protein, partial [Algibacter sp.]|uniref:T9SS type A sorting domain-containing protein n=1 Tax=Algibacter sp. TaxID=1872428 RepID=UPI003C74EC69
NANDGSAYLTFDMQCQKIVTSVNIYFHKGDTRSSSFKIATSNDGINFSDATSVLTSSGTTVGFEAFQLTPNPTVQYVRILGYGNSEGSGWNSYEEVEIHGNNDCSTLSVNDISEKSDTISIYSVPTKGECIYISSERNRLGTIKIFDVQGKLLHVQKTENTSTKIDIRYFSKGVYLLKTDGGTKRFVIN